MIFKETALKGAYLMMPEPHEDERGSFARTYCEATFKVQGIHFRIVQTNLSSNLKRGTRRGMHYQVKPFEEAKIVQCIRGAIYDVIIDLRKDSPTFLSWNKIDLSSENCQSLYIPEGFAHGFQTLEDHTEILYLMSKPYHPESARGIAWNDPAFGIDWPIDEAIMSEKDAAYPLYQGHL